VLTKAKAATARAAKARILSKPETDPDSESASSESESAVTGTFEGLGDAGEPPADMGADFGAAEPSPASDASPWAATGAFAAPALRGTLAGAIGAEAGFKGADAGFKGAEAGLRGADFAAVPEAGAAAIGIVAGETVVEGFGPAAPAPGAGRSGTVCKPELAPAPTGGAIAAGRTGAEG
jgi:hypothetical protein